MDELDVLELALEYNGVPTILKIGPRKPGTLLYVSDAEHYFEASHQFIEGCFYDYDFSDSQFSIENSIVVNPSTLSPNRGSITTNTYIGTLFLNLLFDGTKIDELKFEVRSLKISYRNDYREMLTQITKFSTELIMQINSPSMHYFEIDYELDSKTLYQKFQFIKSIISSESFDQAVHKVISAPVTSWEDQTTFINLNRSKRFTRSNIKTFASGSDRLNLPVDHILRGYNINSIPRKISSATRKDSVDTPENRFIKHSLKEYLHFFETINSKSQAGTILYNESLNMTQHVESLLSHSVFNDISRPQSLKLNSPVLQRKEGYRELFQTWLVFNLAAILTWDGGDSIYSAGKKNIAVLYEYWLYFVILKTLSEISDIDENIALELIHETNNNLSLKLQQGIASSIQGQLNYNDKNHNYLFSYNRVFNSSIASDFSSWSVTMKPDYTISLWPGELSLNSANECNRVVHLHFDAKYKLSRFDLDLISNIDRLNEDEDKSNQKNYKNADVLKMHAYKDGISGSLGAYVLYPGEINKIFQKSENMTPSIGAISVNPSNYIVKNGNLKQFLVSIIDSIHL